MRLAGRSASLMKAALDVVPQRVQAGGAVPSRKGRRLVLNRGDEVHHHYGQAVAPRSVATRRSAAAKTSPPRPGVPAESRLWSNGARDAARAERVSTATWSARDAERISTAAASRPTSEHAVQAVHPTDARRWPSEQRQHVRTEPRRFPAGSAAGAGTGAAAVAGNVWRRTGDADRRELPRRTRRTCRTAVHRECPVAVHLRCQLAATRASSVAVDQ